MWVYRYFGLYMAGKVIMRQQHIGMVHGVAKLTFFGYAGPRAIVLRIFKGMVLVRIHNNLPRYKAEQ